MPNHPLLSSPYASFYDLLSTTAKLTLIAMLADPDIAGATDPGTLTQITGSLLAFHQSGRVLQLGTYIGWSTVVIGNVLKQMEPTGHLVTVDPEGRVLNKAKAYAMQAGVYDQITFIHGKSTHPETVLKLRQLGPFDMIYIDASHAYRETLVEIDEYLRPEWLGPNPIVFFHDAGENARAFDPTGEGGVRRALDEMFGSTTAQRLEGGLSITETCDQFPCGLAVYVPRRKL